MIWWGVLILAAAAQAKPTYFDERQTGTRDNYLVNLTDTNIILIPTKELTNAALQLAFIGKSDDPWRGFANRLFRLAGLGRVPGPGSQENTTPQQDTSKIPETVPATSPADAISSSTTVSPVQKKKTTRKEESEELTLIQTGIEECGPEGHRDSLGICNYGVPSSNP